MMPKNWKTYKLGDIAGVQTGPFGSQLHKKDYVQNGTPIITVEHLGANRITYQNLPRVSDEDRIRLKKYWIEEGDIVFSRVGSVDRRAYVTKSEDGWLFSGRCLRVRPKNEFVNGSYLSYYFGQESFKEYIRQIAVGATMPSINTSILSNVEITIPDSLPEQAAIAAILSSLDDKIELNLQTNKTLEEMAMTLYKHWFVDFGPFKDGKFIDSELGQIPEGWEVKRLGDFIDLNPRLSIKKGTEAPFVEMKVLPTDAMSVSGAVSKEFKGGAKFQNGDTLYARITPCLENGKTAFVDFLEDDEIAFGSTEFLVMRAKKGVSKFWTYCISRDPVFRRFSISTMVGTSGRQRVQNDPFLSFDLPKPPDSVFESFSDSVEDWFSKIRINTLENQTLTALRDTLLPKLISGEVRVKDAEQTLTKII